MPNGKQRREDGIAYLALLLAIALIALTTGNAISLGSAMARRDAEGQLLVVGLEFQKALRSHAGVPAVTAVASPSARGPRALEDLLRDPRVPGVKRHLRQLYADPLTGRDEWGLLKDPEGFIVGVYSLAEGKPIRQSELEPSLAAFEDSQSYSQWVFGFSGIKPNNAGLLPR
jgi:hypothetical protein